MFKQVGIVQKMIMKLIYLSFCPSGGKKMNLLLSIILHYICKKNEGEVQWEIDREPLWKFGKEIPITLV